MSPETAHNVTLKSLKVVPNSILRGFQDKTIVDRPVEAMGLKFPNVVGLAAGLDKNGDYFNELGQMGFGFIEVGSVTPKAQPGNAKPRMFRLVEMQAVINRMGFNNKGLEHLVERVKKRKYQGILGINIGKNLTTPLEHADDDYVFGMRSAYPLADYIAVNISSPNTPGLRSLQRREPLQALIETLMNERKVLADQCGRLVPLAIKVSPDMLDEDYVALAELAIQFGVDGIIAGNTTVERKDVVSSPFAEEDGGLSGRPLAIRARRVISFLSEQLRGSIPIIGVGGISSGKDAVAHLQAGATLVQMYTGLVYRGPELINEIRRDVSQLALRE